MQWETMKDPVIGVAAWSGRAVCPHTAADGPGVTSRHVVGIGGAFGI